MTKKTLLTALLARLVERFKPTRQVKLVWTDAWGSYAGARGPKYQIRIARRALAKDWKATVAHEFAHILTFEKSRAQYRKVYGYESHGKEFYESLLEVVRELWPNLSDYPWTDEYLKIYKRAHADGLVTEPWCRQKTAEQVAEQIARRRLRFEQIWPARASLSIGMSVTVDGKWPGIITRIMRTNAEVRVMLRFPASPKWFPHTLTYPIDQLLPALPAAGMQAASPFRSTRRKASPR